MFATCTWVRAAEPFFEMPNVLFQVICVAPRTHLEQTAPVKRRQSVPIDSNLRALELRFRLTAAAGVAASSILGAVEFLPAQWHHQLQMSCSSYSCSYTSQSRARLLQALLNKHQCCSTERQRNIYVKRDIIVVWVKRDAIVCHSLLQR